MEIAWDREERTTVSVRFIRWILNRLSVTTWLSLALLTIALVTLARGLADLIRDLDPEQLVPVVIAGGLMSWILARSRLAGWLAGILTSVLGVGAIFVRVGRLGQPITIWLRSVAQLAWQALHLTRWTPDHLLTLDIASPVLAFLELGQDMDALVTRVRDWTVALFGGQPTFDPVATALVWSVVLWAVSAWASWFVRRHDRPIVALFPAGTLLALNIYYTYAKPEPLVTLLGAMLLLQALRSHIVRQRRWQAISVSAIDGWGELAAAVIGLSFMLMLIATTVPSVSIQDIVQSVDRILTAADDDGDSGYVGDALGLEARPRPKNVFDQARSAGLPTQHLLGSGPELSRQVAMWVSVEGYYPIPMQMVEARELENIPPRYYWRSLTYDRYTGRGWYTDKTQNIEYKAGEIAYAKAITVHHQIVRQKVRPAVDLAGFLYLTGELVTTDRDYRVAWRGPGDAFGAQIEEGDEEDGESGRLYWVDSLSPRVGEEELRAAGSSYPERVTNRYLDLPPNLPPRIRELALDLTATEPTPYDRVIAIERYLRSFPYSLDLPTPPPGWDVADYFLFELREGYCDYFSTAMVVLARAAGLPARLVIGYASGGYDPAQAHFVVTEADAHAWVEVYFPDYGWIEFEPTSGRPPIERTGDPLPDEGDVFPPLVPEPPPDEGIAEQIHPVWFWALAALAIWGLWSFARRFSDQWRIQHLSPQDFVTALYHRLNRYGQRLAQGTEAGDTPYEFSERLREEIWDVVQGRHRWLAPALAPADKEVRWLTDLYVRTSYSPHPPTKAETSQAMRVWQQLRLSLWAAWGIKGWTKLWNQD